MKNKLYYSLALMAGLFLSASTFNVVYSQTTGKKDAILVKTPKYTCPMHPDVTKNKPGDCPKCGMALVLKSDAKSGNIQGATDSSHQHMNQGTGTMQDTSRWKKDANRRSMQQDTGRWKNRDVNRGTMQDTGRWKKRDLKGQMPQDSAQWKKGDMKRDKPGTNVKSGTNYDNKSMKKDTTRWRKDATKRSTMKDTTGKSKTGVNRPSTPTNP